MLFSKLNATLNSFVSSSLPVDVCGAQLQRVKKVVAELNICHGLMALHVQEMKTTRLLNGVSKVNVPLSPRQILLRQLMANGVNGKGNHTLSLIKYSCNHVFNSTHFYGNAYIFVKLE